MNYKRPAIAIIHLLVIIVAYSSPFWLDWRLFLVGLALYYLQLLIFGACVLTIAEFGTKDAGFVVHYTVIIFRYFGWNVSKSSLKFFFNRILPALLTALALIAQLIIGINPLVSL